MLKKKGILGLLLVVLCSFVVVEAKEALTAEKFEEKMEELGYETSGYGDSVYAYPKDESMYDTDETYFFGVYESADKAQEYLDEAYDEMDDEDVKNLKRSKTSSGNSSCIEISGEEDGEYAFLIACRVDDTIVMGMTENEDKADTVKDVLKDLGYYSSASWIIVVVIGVLVAIVAAVVVIVIMSSKKKKNNMNGMYPNNGMGFNQPMNNGFNPNMVPPMNNMNPPMDQNMNMAPPMNNMNPMDNGMNNGFNPNMGQPMNNMNPPMDQNMNMAPPMNNMNPMDNGMNNGFNPNMGQPMNNMNPPMDQNMNMAPPMNNMDPNMNNNPMNNNFPNMN